jgi:hypothetical protein
MSFIEKEMQKRPPLTRAGEHRPFVFEKFLHLCLLMKAKLQLHHV